MNLISVTFLSFITEIVTGRYRAICPTHPLEAELGDRIQLPCRLEPPYNVSGYTVDWTRADLNKAVHVYRNGRDDTNPQMEQYRTRTNLNHEDLSRGILDLRISSLQLSDRGSYKCNVPKLSTSCNMVLSFAVEKQLNRTKTGESSTKRPQVEKETTSGAERMLVPSFILLLLLFCFSSSEA